MYAALDRLPCASADICYARVRIQCRNLGMKRVTKGLLPQEVLEIQPRCGNVAPAQSVSVECHV